MVRKQKSEKFTVETVAYLGHRFQAEIFSDDNEEVKIGIDIINDLDEEEDDGPLLRLKEKDDDSENYSEESSEVRLKFLAS